MSSFGGRRSGRHGRRGPRRGRGRRWRPRRVWRLGAPYAYYPYLVVYPQDDLAAEVEEVLKDDDDDPLPTGFKFLRR